jgi:predicted nucleic acid-binding protein
MVMTDTHVVYALKKKRIQVAGGLTTRMLRCIPAGMDTLFSGLLKRLTRVSMDTKIATLAHDLRNHYANAGGNKLKTPDAIHLATAILFRADEFHTFDEALIALSGDVAGHRLIVCKPVAKNPELDL